MNMDIDRPRADATLDGSGNGCTDLTPLIRETISALPSGAVLEVFSDDLVAREGVPAWTRMTGHTLLQTIPVPGGITYFYIKRK